MLFFSTAARNLLMRSDVVISVKNLSKTYRIFGHPGDRIKQAMTLGQRRFHKEFTALKDVSFDIKKGETVGIIGSNGSGKSTLLQLVCGILKQSSGSVEVQGRISALLELGAGFNAEFTGRENVFFQGAVLGIAKEEMALRFDDIAAFADIGEFIDQPVRTYSSGMYMRLAFSVAIHVKPDILIVDEALSVGDAAFQHRSMKRARELVDSGTSLLLVSHDRSMITATCSRCILLEKGQAIMDGLPSDVFDYYLARNTKGSERVHLDRLDSGRSKVVSGTGEARVEMIRLLNSEEMELETLEAGMPVTLELLVRAHQPIPQLALVFTLRDRLGQTIFSINTNSLNQSPMHVPAGALLKFRFHFYANLGTGSYSVSTILLSSTNRFTDNFETRELAYFFEIQNVSLPVFAGSVWLNPELDIQVC